MKRYYAVFLVLILLICCNGCDTYSVIEQYPWYKSEQWYCEEIDFSICFAYSEGGCLIESPSSQLCWNEQIYNVNVVFQSNAIEFLIDKDGDNISEALLAGTWAYRNKNLVVNIVEDNVFAGAYAELLFVPQ